MLPSNTKVKALFDAAVEDLKKQGAEIIEEVEFEAEKQKES